MTRHSGQTKILLTITHEAASEIKRPGSNVRKGIDHVRAIAPQLTGPQRWFAMVQYIVDQILACATKPNLKNAHLLTG